MNMFLTLRRSGKARAAFVSITWPVLIFAFAAASVMLWPRTCLAQAKPEEQVVAVRTLLSKDAAKPGDVVKVAVVLKIQSGYHINDSAPLDEFLFPTALTPDESQEISVLETYFPTGHRARFAYSQAELVVYEGEAVLGLLLKVAPGTAPCNLTLKATLTYQACNNTSCLPPKELPFEIQIPIVAAGAAVKDINQDVFDKIPFKSLVK